MLNDVRYAFRTLRQSPGFALTAILSIALAIGANSTFFSYADGLLLRPPPVPNPSGVVVLRSIAPTVSVSSLPGSGPSRMSYADFEDFRRNNKSFEGMAAWDLLFAAFAKDANAPVEFRLGSKVSADFFRVLGVEPQLGRGFLPEEDEIPAGDPVVVLSHDFWTKQFSADPSVLGRHVRLNNLTFTVVGVAPESFTGLDPFTQDDFYVPIAMASKLNAFSQSERTDRSLRWFMVFGRLKSGVSIQSAAQEAAALAKSLEQAYPATNRGFGATVSTVREVRLISLPLLEGLVGALAVLAAVILFIASANVANLMFGRGRARAREIAVRLAIGASRRRLLHLLLIESMLIALASGALALVVAKASIGILSNVSIPSDLPIHLSFQIDERVLWFTVATSAASALLFGFVPAIQSTRLDLASNMKAGELERHRSRCFGSYALVVIQIAGTMILLVLTTHGRRNFDNVLAGNPGFRRDHRITMRFDPEASGYSPERTQQFFERAVDKASEISGIKSAALASGLPLTYDPERIEVIPEGYDFPPGRESTRVLSYIVDHHYFDTLGVPILAGRAFRATDRADTSRVVIVNEAFANEYLGRNPIGKRMRLKRYDSSGRLIEASAEVVGVAMTVKTFLLTEPPAEVVYLPFTQNTRDRLTLIAETAGDPAAMAGPLKTAIQSLDPNLPIFRVRTMDDIFEHSSVSLIRAVGRIYDLAAGLGLIMALVGLYAVVSYQVVRRTREVGIRMALGARRTQVLKIFLGYALSMSLTGVILGLMLSLFANRLSETALGIGKLDPLFLSTVSAALLLTTLAASLIPARRAARIDPLQALREE